MSVARSPVVVAVSGSPSSSRALAFAVAEARLRGLPLTVLHAWQPPLPYEGTVLMDDQDVEDAEAGLLQAAADTVDELAPGLEHEQLLVRDRADAAVVAASRTAALVVLGRHDGNPAWLGPVLGHAAARACCPVVAVPASAPSSHDGIVVGVDGSAVSSAAVDFAFAQAAAWGSPLTALLAVPRPFDAYLPSAEQLDQIHERGRRHLAEALAGASTDHPDVVVTHLVSLDAPFCALRQAAGAAALVVVGTHGRGAVLRVTLGSVSSSLLRAAPCAVALVRPVDAAERQPAADTWPEAVPQGQQFAALL